MATQVQVMTCISKHIVTFLTLKLRRDFRKNWTQFFSVFLMAFLSVLIFVGLQGAWHGLEVSLDTYIKDANLADSWVMSTGFTKQDKDEISTINGVKQTGETTRIQVKVDKKAVSEKQLFLETFQSKLTQPQLYGDGGNDTLRGGAGHDRLYGGEGDDRLYGDAGDDTLDGGRGNDLLQGGEDNDTYIFGRGYCFDRAEDYQGINTIRFLDGIKSIDLSVQYNNNSLYLTIRGTTDTLIIEHFKSNPSYRNFNLVFSDEKAVDVKDFVKEKTSVSSIRQMVKSFSDYQLDSQPVMGAIDASIAQQTDQIIQAMVSFDTKGNVASLGKLEIMDDSLVYRSSMVQNWVNSVSS